MIDTAYVLLGRIFGFLDDYLVVTARYLVVTARYRSLLLVPTFGMNVILLFTLIRSSGFLK